jgi:hypothetical protein
MVDGQPAEISFVKDNSHDEVPVVALVPWNRDTRLDHSHEPGASNFYIKSLHFEAFVDAVQQLGSSWLPLNQVTQQ